MESDLILDIVDVVHIVEVLIDLCIQRLVVVFLAGSSPTLIRTISNNSVNSGGSRESRGSRGSILSLRRSSHSQPKTIYQELSSKLQQIEVDDLVEDSQQRKTFKIMLTDFASKLDPDTSSDLSRLVVSFQMVAAKTLNLMDPLNTPFHLLYLAYFIDYLLTLGCSLQQRNFLLSYRHDLCSKKIRPMMKIEELPKFQLISRIYNVSFSYLNNRVFALKGECRKADILSEIEHKKESYRYSKTEFASREHYIFWLQGRTRFIQKAIDRFGKERDENTRPGTRKVGPKEPLMYFQQVLGSFLESEESSDDYMEIIKDCMLIWQIDGYDAYFAVLYACLKNNTITEERLQLARTVLEFGEFEFNPHAWPKPIQLGLEPLNGFALSSLKNVTAEFDHLFDDLVKDIVIQLDKIENSSLLGITDQMQDTVTKKLRQVTKDKYISLSSCLGRKSSMKEAIVSLENVEKHLNHIIQNVSDKYDAKWNFKILKQTLATDILADVRNMVESSSKVVEFNGIPIRMYESGKQDADMMIILQSFIRIKNLARLSDDEFTSLIEPVFYPECYVLCQQTCHRLLENQAEIFNHKDAIQVLDYFEKCLLTDQSLQWKNKQQKAVLLTLFYKTISTILINHTNELTEDVLMQLSTSHLQDLFVKINKLYLLHQEVELRFRDDVLEEISELTRSLNLANFSKVLMIRLVKAENMDPALEDSSDLMVKVSGHSEFQTSVGEPYWDEEFEIVADDNMVALDLILLDCSEKADPIASFSTTINLDSIKESTQQKLKLTSSNGIHLYITYAFERALKDPVFFVGQINLNFKRACNKIMKKTVATIFPAIKDVFTRHGLNEMKQVSPRFYKINNFLQAEEDPENVRDPLIVGLASHIENELEIIKSSLRHNAFEDFMAEVWSSILSRATNMLLPSLTFIEALAMDSSIDAQLASPLNGLKLEQEANKSDLLSIDDYERIFSWVYKLFALVCTNVSSRRHFELFRLELYQFIQARGLYHQTLADLQNEYRLQVERCESQLRYRRLARRDLTRCPKIIRSHGTCEGLEKLMKHEYDRQYEDRNLLTRELMLRVIFAKDGVRSIEYISQKVEEFERMSFDISTNQSPKSGGSKRSSRLTIEKQISNANENADWLAIRGEINNLKNWVSGLVETSAISMYDLKIHTKSIDDLVFELDSKKRTYNQRRFKFSFKPEKATRPSIKSNTVSTLGAPTLQDVSRINQKVGKSHENVYVDSISNSVVVIPADGSAGAITLKNCTNCVFFVDSSSFVYLEGISSCVVVGKAHQLRIHKTVASYIDTQIQSELNKIIIEESNQLIFVDHNSVKVEDFSHPALPSPNYRFASEHLALDADSVQVETLPELLASKLKAVPDSEK
ncbi:hypothetical protein OGAPHI_004863 [Ogataea philodendri]|uniref:C-CAP/cofactor C-like domain-containing protein n=1 Tax=Ogataea philodendri TaxID=1378263 RepID=A0A9P8P324_9ASCO|nr:uncharacterized protein OGAPHI_004863 [Ogataea philodendri]KAH3664149.1 hypothetical protein OGAPHI_004863 [Ogataea philodendri]